MARRSGPRRPTEADSPSAKPSTPVTGPIYARDRARERALSRTILGSLVTLCLVLACRPAERSPVTRPPAAPPEPPPQKVEVKPIETARLLPKAEAPPPAAQVELGPLILRVGLATDLETVKLPCCDSRIRLVAGGGGLELPFDAPIEVRPAADVEGRAVYRLQVAALKDERQAQGIADYLTESTPHPSDSVFDADTDLYRVRVGKFADRESAEALRGELAGLGVIEGWVVSEGGGLEGAAFEVRHKGRTLRVPGRWLEVRAEEGVGIPFGRTRYRGQLLLYLNDRGRLNAINEIQLEDYLRGVVPKEMGPELYNRIEALKAQSVAARTYTLRNLGEFSEEGYDICSTPRCQVYGGMPVEHPVSDRAIRETAGQVLLYEGQPAETFYSATSGGHTENVEVIFPLKTGAYLRGVPCMESGATLIEGSLAKSTRFPGGLMQRLLPAEGGAGARTLAVRLEQLAQRARLPVPKDRLASLERAEVLRYVISLFDTALDRRLGVRAREVDLLLKEPPDDWRDRDLRLAGFLRSSGYLDGSKERLDATDGEALLFELALYLEVLREEQVHFSKLNRGQLEVRRGRQRSGFPLPSALATFRRRGQQLVSGPLDLMAGDRLRLYWQGSALLALVQPVDSPDVDFGKRAPRSRWSTFKTDGQLRAAVQRRYPGFPFRTFEVLERGVSGRVGKMALLGTGDERLVVEGLAVRWTLDVWDTLFWAERQQSKSGQPGWFFRGRGWGHGVGMSQAGAYGMAVRGSSYREILEHYYTGVRLGRLKPVAPRPRHQASAPRTAEATAGPRGTEAAAAAATQTRTAPTY
ncbi:MAG: SpoIID/LytB domain-containing protein [Acidobacteriota bacterium]